jgi:hypothetical protein
LLSFSPKYVVCLISKQLKFKIYKTVILPVVLYGCETWSFISRAVYRLSGFENRVLRRIFGPTKDEDKSWRILYNDKIRGRYSTPYIVRVIKSRRTMWEGHGALMGEGRVFTGFWLGGLKVRDHWENLGVGGRIILIWSLGK